VLELRACRRLRRYRRLEAVRKDTADSPGMPGPVQQGRCTIDKGASQLLQVVIGGRNVGEAMVDHVNLALISQPEARIWVETWGRASLALWAKPAGTGRQ